MNANSRTPFNTPSGSVYFPEVRKFTNTEFYQEEINSINKKILDALERGDDELALIYSECKRKIEELRDK